MNQSSALDLKSSLEQLIITHIIFYEVRLLLSHHLAVFDQELGHAVSTMNRSFALDLKSPLERGVDGSIVDGVCARPAKARMFSGRKRPTGEEVRAP